MNGGVCMKNYIIGRICMVGTFVVFVGLFFLCVGRIEQSRITAQMEQIKDNKINTTHCRTLTVEGGWIYFIPDSGYGNLYKMKLDGSERQKLVDREIKEFVLYEGRIYYPWRDYDEKENKYGDGYISSIGTDGGDERQIIQLQRACYLNVVGGRIYYINDRYGNGIFESAVHSVALDGSDRRIHNDEDTIWLKVINNVIYYMCHGNDTYMLCSVKTDGSDLTLIFGNFYIPLAESAWQNISIFGDTIYFNGTQSLKLDGSSALKDVKTDGTNIANGRIYYTDNNHYKTDRTQECPWGYYEEWVICSAKINSRGKYEDEKVLYTEAIDLEILDHYPYLIYIIGDRLYFRGRAPNRSLYSMNLDGGDLWKIE